MLQARTDDMFQTAYAQLSQPERSFVDRLVADMADAAARHGVSAADLIDTPLPAALRERDTRGWLDRPLVRAAITDKLTALRWQAEISMDRLIRELYSIATFNITDIMSFDSFGEVTYDLEDATPEQRAAIESVEMDKSDGMTRSTRTKMKVKAHSKLGAIKQLTDLLGGVDAPHSYRASKTSSAVPQLTDDRSTAQAADDYARFMEGGTDE